MGQRANLIIVTNGSAEICYTHHRANTLDQDLFWGPSYAQGFIRMQQPVPDGRLLDEVWAEGGAVMDLDRRYLLWFGAEDLQADVPLRRMHHRLMSHLWTGWHIDWASEGALDLARYIGSPQSSVLRTENEPSNHNIDARLLVKPKEKPKWDVVASVCFCPKKFRFCSASVWRLSTLLFCGSPVVDAMRENDLPTQLQLLRHFPRAGVHIDTMDRAIHFWLSSWSADILRRTKESWPGWSVHWHKDRFESHMEQTEERLQFPCRGDGALLADLRSLLLRPNSEQSGAESVAEIAKLLTGTNNIKAIQINPDALHDAQLVMPIDLRTCLFESAVASLNI
jgi:hypothetical protein